MPYPIAFLLLAVALAVSGCGGGGKSSATTTTTTSAETTTATTTTTTTTTSAATTTAQAAKPVTINVTVKGGKPVGGIQRATARKNDTIVLVVRSDVADEVHFHGYDLMKDVEAGGAIRMRFKANIVGVFEAELEGRKLQIVQLTVR